MSEKEIKRILRPKFKLLWIGLVALAIGIGSIFFLEYWDEELQYPNPEDYSLVREKSKEKNELYVNATITEFSEFATSENGNVFCFVKDNNDNKFIVRIYSGVYEDWLEQSKGEESFEYELCGYLVEPSENVKRIAIEQYNEMVYDGRPMLSENNFGDRLGSYILDGTYHKPSVIPEIIIILMVVGNMAGIASIVFFIVNAIKFAKRCAAVNMDIIKSELSKRSTIAYPKVGVYLTDKYVITVSGIFVSMIEYKELAQVYVEKYKYEFIPVCSVIIGKSINNKSYNLAFSYKKIYLDEIVAAIKLKNTKIVAGNFKGNINDYKDIAKKAKGLH